MSIASLILGICSIVAAVFGLGFPIGAIAGIVGIIMGIYGKKDPEKAGMAKAGFICSIIGTILSLLFVVLCASCLGGIGAIGSLY